MPLSFLSATSTLLYLKNQQKCDLFQSSSPGRGRWVHRSVPAVSTCNCGSGRRTCVCRYKQRRRDAKTDEAKMTECTLQYGSGPSLNRFLSKVYDSTSVCLLQPSRIALQLVCKACCSAPICPLAVQIQELCSDDL